MNDFVIKFEDLNFKINPPTFNEFLKTEVKCKAIDIEKITKTIDSKKLEFTIKESTDTVIYENFMKWKNIIAEQNKKIHTGNNAHRGICCLDRIDTDH